MINPFENKQNIFISIGVLITLSVIITLVVFKVSGSDTSQNISQCTPYNITIEKGEREFTAKINWMTKSECAGFVTYGDSSNTLSRVGVDTVNGVKNRKHEVVLESLVSSKEYYFSIVSDSQNYGNNGLPISFTLNSL